MGVDLPKVYVPTLFEGMPEALDVLVGARDAEEALDVQSVFHEAGDDVVEEGGDEVVRGVRLLHLAVDDALDSDAKERNLKKGLVLIRKE